MRNISRLHYFPVCDLQKGVTFGVDGLRARPPTMEGLLPPRSPRGRLQHPDHIPKHQIPGAFAPTHELLPLRLLQLSQHPRHGHPPGHLYRQGGRRSGHTDALVLFLVNVLVSITRAALYPLTSARGGCSRAALRQVRGQIHFARKLAHHLAVTRASRMT